MRRRLARCYFSIHPHLVQIGFDTWAFIPAARLFCTSSEKALAIIAMIGMVRPSRFLLLRIAFVASTVHMRHLDIHKDRIIFTWPYIFNEHQSKAVASKPQVVHKIRFFEHDLTVNVKIVMNSLDPIRISSISFFSCVIFFS